MQIASLYPLLPYCDNSVGLATICQEKRRGLFVEKSVRQSCAPFIFSVSALRVVHSVVTAE